MTSGRCLIPEALFDLERLVPILVEDKRENPSGYAFIIAAESAMWKGGAVSRFGPADAFDHRRKANIAETLAEVIRERSDEKTLASELTYDQRSGDPDALDQTVAITFANIAVDLIRDGVSGRMVAIEGGNFVHTALPDPTLGTRRVDVTHLCNEKRFRPQYADRLGSARLGASIFLVPPGI